VQRNLAQTVFSRTKFGSSVPIIPVCANPGPLSLSLLHVRLVVCLSVSLVGLWLKFVAYVVKKKKKVEGMKTWARTA
jgi:hypothetical protein